MDTHLILCFAICSMSKKELVGKIWILDFEFQCPPTQGQCDCDSHHSS